MLVLKYIFMRDGVLVGNPKPIPAEPTLCNLTQQDQCEDRSVFIQKLMRHVCRCRAIEIGYETSLQVWKNDALPIDDGDVRYAEALIKIKMPDRGAVWNGIQEDTVYEIPPVEVIIKDQKLLLIIY